MAPRLRPFGWHVEILTNTDDLPAIEMDLRSSEIPIVLDHLSFVNVSAGLHSRGFQAMLRLVGGGHVVTKLSAAFRVSELPDYADVKPFVAALVAASPDHLVWGSDWPHISFSGAMPQNATLLESIAAAVPDLQALRKILVNNPARVYGAHRHC